MPDRRQRVNEECPPWCIVDHTQHVLPQDYLHESNQLAVPVVILRRYSDAMGHVHHYPFSVTLDIVRYQYPHDFEQWVFIGGEDTPGIDLTVESAQRLGEMLRRVGGSWGLASVRQGVQPESVARRSGWDDAGSMSGL